MILINVKFTARREYADSWMARVDAFTRATREEPGNVFYEWSKSVDDEHQYVLLEAFESAEAGAVHVNSEHFKTAIAWMPDAVAETPQIINVEVPGTGWSAMAEVQPRR